MGTAILAATTQAAYVQKNHTLIWAYIPIKFPIHILSQYMQKCKYLFYILFTKILIWKMLYYIDFFSYQFFIYSITIFILGIQCIGNIICCLYNKCISCIRVFIFKVYINIQTFFIYNMCYYIFP